LRCDRLLSLIGPFLASIEIPQNMSTSSSPLNPDTPPLLLPVTVTELSDPTTVGQSIEVLEQDVVKLSSRPLRGRRIIVRLVHCLVVYHLTNLPVRARTCLQAGFVAYTGFGSGSVGTANGLPIGPDKILASASGLEVEFIVAAGYESVAFLLPLDMMRDHAIRRHREDEFRIPQNVGMMTPCSAGARELYEWGRCLIDIASRQPDVFDDPRAQSAAQVDLLEKILATLGSASQTEPSLQDLTRQKHSHVVRIAENYANSHIADRIHVTDLCEAAGVCERTLQYAFKELLGMAPMAYLTRLRLHRARQTLRAATHASTTVTKEALRWGFWHFGDFSRAYKECFGELPSDTLRRQPDTGEFTAN